MATALREPQRPPTRGRPRNPLWAAAIAAGLLVLILAVAIIGALEGQQSGSCASPATSATAPLPAAGTAGRTLQGRVSWFGGPHDPISGPTTADGKPVSDPGIAVYDTATLNGYWWVRFTNGRAAILQQTDIGPAPWTGRVLDVLYSALPSIGYTEQDFPTDSTITARYLGSSPQLAAAAVHLGSPAAGQTCSASITGNPSAQAVLAAANLLASMHVPYNYGGGHITPARPTGGQEGSYPGLDCSSAVSFVLQHAGINVPTMVSGQYMTWGDSGPGQYVTLYANTWHIFMKIGNRYFGTSGFGHPAAGTGPAWFTVDPSPSYLALFVVRHPPGM